MQINYWGQQEQQQLLPPPNNSFQDLDENNKKLLEMELQSLSKAAEKINTKMDNYLKALTELIKNNSFNKIPMEIDYQIKNPTESPICSRTVGYSPQTSRIFKCFDCMQAGNAIQCPTCFSAANHQGHNYHQMFSGDGCCDCGNQQMLNPRGFCPAHSKKITEIEIDPIVKVMFLKETTFLTYVCFWLLEKVQLYKMNKVIATLQCKELFDTLLNFSRRNYDFKFLCVSMLKKQLGVLYPTLPQIKNKNLSIIQMVFQLQSNPFMSSFFRLMLELFPVQQLKFIVIKQYFNKSQNDSSFGFTHPLRMLNFQYMTCIKTINSLIKQKELKALRLPNIHKLQSSSHDNNSLNLLFLKFIDDLQYPTSMKAVNQYFKCLVQQQVITDIFFTYRQLPDSFVNKPHLDMYYLKTFKNLLSSIINEKQLLKKVIVQLWNYIIKVKIPNESLVHERAFALAVTALFEGNIRLLHNPRNQEQFLQLLALSYDNIQNVLPQVIQSHLQSVLSSMLEKLQPIQNDQIFMYFMETNTELEISFKCDCSYQKILLLISSYSIDFTKITDRLIDKIQNSQNQTLKILKLVTFFNFVFAVDADELALSNLLGFQNKKLAFQFYSKFVSTFSQLKGIQIKRYLRLVNSENECFQQFVKDNCSFEKGLLKQKNQAEKLQYYAYDGFFKPFSIQMGKLTKNRHNLTLLPQFRGLKLWSEQNIDYLIMICNSYNQQLLKMQKSSKYISKLTDQSFGFELIKLFSLFSHQKLRAYLQQMLLPYSKQKNWTFLLTHLRIVLNLTQIQATQAINENMVQLAIKKDKLLQKKKGHQQKMKKQNQQILKIHQKQKQHDSDDKNICIFCRQKTEQNLYIISELTVDNFVAKSIFKSNSLVLSIRSCSHVIHQKCFYQNNTKNNLMCFLCRLPSNILLPIFTDMKEPNVQLCQNLLNLIYPTLNLQYENQIPTINNFYDIQCRGNMLRSVLNSLIFEILIVSWNEPISIKLNVIPVWKQMIALIKIMPTHEVDNAFAIDTSVMQLDCEGAELYKKIRDFLFKYFKLHQIKQPSETGPNEESETQAILNKIVSYFDGSCQFDSGTNLKQLTLIKCNQNVFNLPRKLSVLQQFMGKCPDCSIITQKMCICLICGWKACLKKRQALREHSKLHLNGAIMIKCDTGQLLFILRDGMFGRKSIYLNYIGESYVLKDFSSSEPQNYYLNEQKYAEICNSIARNRLKAYMIKQLS